MAPGNQRDRFFVVHRHARKGLADISGGGERIRIAIWPLWVHIDQTHLHGREWVLEVSVARVALVTQPLYFFAPVDVPFRLPDVCSPTTEAKGLETHRLQRAVAGEDNQVGPGYLVAVFLLNWPQQAARFVEVGVVGPAIERRKALGARTSAAASVADAVGACAVPRHADKERAIVTKVSRPPVLRVRHQRVEVLLQGLQIELLELLGIVEGLVHRIGQG